MTLQDIIERTAAIIGVEESALNMPTQIYNKIRDSVVTVYTELITEFVPLRTKEKVNISGGKLFYEDLTYRVREILAIKTSVGRLKFNEYPEYVQTDNYDGEAEIEYLYYTVPAVNTDRLILPPQFTEYVLAVGAAAEYFYRSSLLDEAVFFRNRFETAVNNLTKRGRVFNLPPRRLL